MPVFLTVLKILAILIAVLLILVITALLLPLGFAIEYQPAYFRISAVYGPLRRTIWSHRMHRQGKTPIFPSVFAGTEKEKPAASKDIKGTPAQAATRVPKEPAPGTSAQPDLQMEQGTIAEPALREETEEKLPSGVMGRLERMLLLLEENPKALAKCVLGHMHWLHRHSIFKISIRHADVFWTVTCEDAAATAIAYGAEMAAMNTALALVQQTVRLQSDRLWLEPDFTGDRRAERRIACTVSASAILMLHLLYRIWKDPLLQPQEQPEPQKID